MQDVLAVPGHTPLKPISTRHLHRAFVNAVQVARIADCVGQHTLRHSFAIYLPEYGTESRMIQVLLGHAKPHNMAF